MLPDANGVTVTYDESCDIAVSSVIRFDQTLAQYAAAQTSYATPTDGVTVDISPARPGRGGGFDFTVTTKTRQYRDMDTAAGTFSASGRAVAETIFEKRKEWRQRGVTTQTLRAITRADGYIKSQSVDDKADCSKDADTTEREAQNVEVAKTYDYVSATQTVSRVTDINDLTADSTPSQEPLKIKSLSVEKNDYGRFDNTNETKVVIPYRQLKTYLTRHGTVTVILGDEQDESTLDTDLGTCTNLTENNLSSWEHTEADKHSYRITRRPYDDGADGSAENEHWPWIDWPTLAYGDGVYYNAHIYTGYTRAKNIIKSQLAYLASGHSASDGWIILPAISGHATGWRVVSGRMKYFKRVEVQIGSPLVPA